MGGLGGETGLGGGGGGAGLTKTPYLPNKYWLVSSNSESESARPQVISSAAAKLLFNLEP